MTAIDAALSVALGGDDDRSRRFIRSALPLAVIRDRRPSAAIQIGRVLRVGRGRVLAADGESGGRFFAQRSSQAGIRPNRGAAPAFQARRHPSTCREPWNQHGRHWWTEDMAAKPRSDGRPSKGSWTPARSAW